MTDYTDDIGLYNVRAVQIATANSDYKLAQAQWEENNALISKLTVLHEIATAASGAALTAEEDMEGIFDTATDDYNTDNEAYAGVADAVTGVFAGGLVQALATALANYEAAEDAVDNAATGT